MSRYAFKKTGKGEMNKKGECLKPTKKITLEKTKKTLFIIISSIFSLVSFYRSKLATY
jgi:hypothetical protein